MVPTPSDMQRRENANCAADKSREGQVQKKEQVPPSSVKRRSGSSVIKGDKGGHKGEQSLIFGLCFIL